LAEQLATRRLTLEEVVQNYDVVDVARNGGDPYIIATPKGTYDPMQQYIEHGTSLQLAETGSKQLADSTSVALGELGSASPSPFTSWMRQEYNPKLIGINGLKQYDKMRKSDATVRASLRLIKTPVLAARWFIEPASDSTTDKRAADFVEWTLQEAMSISFNQVLVESMLMCDFGYYMFEEVWKEDVWNGKKVLTWQKLAPRHPMDVQNWKFDLNGGPLGVFMYPNAMNALDNGIFIPIDKMLVFTFDREAGNIQGVSVLRSAYKHFYFADMLYKIDGIQKERHGIGIPVIVLPPGFGDSDKLAADQLGRNLRTNERAHVVLPPNWQLMFAELKGQPVDIMKSIEHHKGQIRENVLGNFMSTDQTTKVEDQTMFLKATRFLANQICDTFNLYGIPQLVKANFPSSAGVPKLRVRRIGEEEAWRTISFTLRNMVGAEIIRPDDVLEAWARDEFDLPAADAKTARYGDVIERLEVPGKVGPGGTVLPGAQPAPAGTTPSNTIAPKPTKARIGPPRQKPLPPKGSGAGNAGTDRSGG
jgi:hypothetical protein